MSLEFNKYRFDGLGYRVKSNQYWTMNRVSEDGNKCIVRVSDSMVKQTRYGYALAIDAAHVVWLKSWQVSDSYYGVEVMLNREYFTVKESPIFEATIIGDPENHDFDSWLKCAKEQQEAGTVVYWKRDQ